MNKPQASDLEVLNHYHQFIRDDEKDELNKNDWKVRLARSYYNQLYKEYAVIDLSRYTEKKIGLRWRTEKDVIEGNGSIICGNKNCSTGVELKTFELPFHYCENSEDKQELVKVKLCKSCAWKLSMNISSNLVKRTRTEQDEKSNKKMTK